ncbi:MAG TPA: two-component regulator propeller domain-containing protein [Bacteroidales bacterium]|nr:two-component regulator propeller domain-containing protein [Bacteroidales bacterium]
MKKNGFIIAIVITIPLMFSCTKDDEAISPEAVEKWTFYNVNNGLPSNIVNCLTEDDYGNIWIGTNRGLVKYDGTGFRTYSSRSGLPSDTILGLHWDNNDELVVGSANGLGIIKSQSYINILTNSGWECYNSCEDANGNLYTASMYGLLVYSDNQLHLYKLDTGAYDNYITDILCDDYGKIWMAAPFKGLCYVKQNKLTCFPKSKTGMMPYRIIEDKAGNIWMTSVIKDEKVVFYDGYQFVNDTILSEYGDPDYYDHYKAISQDKYGNFWVAIAEKGIFHHAGRMTKGYTTANSPVLMNDVNAILCDSKGNVWFGSNGAGLYCLQNIKPLQFQFGPEYNPYPSNYPNN